MRIYNTLSRQIEEFKPLSPKHLLFYACGPTVYDYSHIGHIRAYVFNDTVRRAFEYLGYNVKHVMNITDVGHLSDDADSGEDKMENGARKYGKTVWDLAKYYTDFFFMSTDLMNIVRPTIVCRATDHIPEIIELIQTLFQKGHTYETKEAVYFDVTTFNKYGALSGQKREEKRTAARNEVYEDFEKKHAQDFVLWFKRVGKFKDHTMHWKSPWGDGFPGWHIECSAMSMKYLGKTIDVHTGGIDHIPVHHENEIAQSEAATGIPFVHYWMHYHFLQVEGQKMSKSLGNFFTIEDIKKRGIDPMAFRLLLLQSHYRQPMNFTWNALSAAQEAYKRMKLDIQKIKAHQKETEGESAIQYTKAFRSAIENDLQTPRAVAVLFTLIKSVVSPSEKISAIADFDRVLGLTLMKEGAEEAIPHDIILLAEKRKHAKDNKNFSEADAIRKQIEEKGYRVEDLKDKYVIHTAHS